MALALLLPSLAVAVSPFVDVVPGKFYETPVNWALNNQITTGKDATHFDPGGQVTNCESVTFLKRYDDNIVQPAITGLTNTVGKSLGQLTCGTSQIPKFDGTNWACNTVGLIYKTLPGTNSAPDTTGTVGLYTSIAIGADDLAIITYYDVTNGDLKVAQVNMVVTGITFG